MVELTSTRSPHPGSACIGARYQQILFVCPSAVLGATGACLAAGLATGQGDDRRQKRVRQVRRAA